MEIIKSFKFAFRGIAEAFKTEKNLKVHFFLAFLAILFAFYFKFSFIEWAILTVTIGLVFITEFINTSLEEIVNMVSPEIQEKARIAKDVAAAGVLFAAFVSILVACLLFLPKLF